MTRTGSRGVKKRWSYETSQTVEVSNGVKRFAQAIFNTLDRLIMCKNNRHTWGLTNSIDL